MTRVQYSQSKSFCLNCLEGAREKMLGGETELTCEGDNCNEVETTKSK